MISSLILKQSMMCSSASRKIVLNLELISRALIYSLPAVSFAGRNAKSEVKNQ